MKLKLTDRIARDLPAPASGNVIAWDEGTAGFGLRVTAAGARAFILNYRTASGRERRYTMGAFPDWQVAAARKHAAELKRRIRDGFDPLAELEAKRAAPTMADLCDRFEAEYLSDESPKLRAATKPPYRAAVAEIRTAFKHRAVADITFSDVDALHRKISRRAAYVANRTVAVASRMFGLAIRWGWRTDNPARGIERNPEERRQRFLDPAELARLTVALAAHPDRQAAAIVTVLMLTGARVGETVAMRWDDLDLAAGVWTKPGATTKQKSEHRVPLSGPARLALAELHSRKSREEAFVFPGRRPGTHRLEFRRAWVSISASAGIQLRIHDLRHTYASVLAASGMSLPIIGALLGHTQPQTTHRYAHLMDDPLRAATERAAAIIGGAESGAVIPLGGRR